MKITISMAALSYNYKDRLKKMGRKYESIASEVRQVRRSLDWKVSGGADIDSRLADVAKKLDKQQQAMERFAAAMDKTVNIYEDAEKRIKRKTKELTYEIKGGVFGWLNYLAKKISEALARHVAALKALIDWLRDLFGWDTDSGTVTDWPDGWPGDPVGDTETSETPEEHPEQGQTANEPKYQVGQKVADLDGEYFVGYNKQCVSYAMKRMREMMGLPVDCMKKGWSFPDGGKSMTEVFSKKIAKVGSDNIIDGYSVNTYTSNLIDNLRPNSIASFNSAGSNGVDGGHGHTLIIEDVVMENGKKYVYFSEGGKSVGEKTGVIQRMDAEAFLKRGGGCNGLVTFSKK